MDSASEPILAAPGAGLPPAELFIGRLLFKLRRLTGNRRAFDADFRKERGLIQNLLRSFDAGSGARRILIRRPPGLEDSSRYWSVWMTLDHLRIVHREFARIIGDLARETLPKGEARTADVKPSLDATEAVVPAYEESCDELLAVVAAAPRLQTAARFAHPWFGPLDAAGWHALAGGHMGIHRLQIQRIREGIEAG